jgi:hypothetical protein
MCCTHMHAPHTKPDCIGSMACPITGLMSTADLPCKMYLVRGAALHYTLTLSRPLNALVVTHHRTHHTQPKRTSARTSSKRLAHTRHWLSKLHTSSCVHTHHLSNSHHHQFILVITVASYQFTHTSPIVTAVMNITRHNRSRRPCSSLVTRVLKPTQPQCTTRWPWPSTSHLLALVGSAPTHVGHVLSLAGVVAVAVPR